MKKIIKPTVALLCSFIFISFTSLTKPLAGNSLSTPKENPKIQVAVLLDVSNSMDGLIEQAKAQLWNMVSTMGKAQCDGKTPQIEIALFEYGRPDNGVANGYVRQISGFTSNLDALSQKLFSLHTNGGDEYCGQVIYTSLNKLTWDAAKSTYKVIFIAGNEDFLQGNLTYTKACATARDKGVIVNTIYCGDRLQGIREHWNLNAECGNGSYTNINQDARIEDIPTPYDSLILSLNQSLNKTYISYGYTGASSFAAQGSVDKMNESLSQTVAVKRVMVKGKKELYKNSTWDIVDAANDDKDFINKVDLKTLPDSLKRKSRTELKQLVDRKNKERSTIQQDISKLAVKRDLYIQTEKARSSQKTQAATLETEIEKIIRKQAKQFRMVIP
jgi:hypothetical protein